MQSLWMLFAAFTFAFMGVCVKLASSLYSTSEIVMYRGLIGSAILFTLMQAHRGTLKTRFPLQHLWRSIIGVISLWMWFYSISKLPLATAMTLNYTAPIWIAVILFAGNWWRDKQRFDWGMAAAILLSFIGVLLLLQPSVQTGQWWAGAVGLLSGIGSSLAYLQVRKLGRMGEPEYRVVFYFSATGAVAGLLGVLAGPTLADGVQWHPHSTKGALLLVTIGITAAVAQMAMTRAYRLGKALFTANLQYTGIVFSSIWGILIWNDVLGWSGWLGIAVILASGLAATFYNARMISRDAAGKTAVDPIATEV